MASFHYRPETSYLLDVLQLADEATAIYTGEELTIQFANAAMLQKNGCHLVLNDNAHVKGNWSEASGRGAEAGLKKFAWIYSPSTFNRIAANKSLPSVYDAVQVAFFNDREEALNWLRQ
ncbi:hypothetical protein [Mucilaginibacter pedocola]|uniref:STAS/SEC14 domain-containing protein n=1 Tax=Mucilaginibacter pedocola TaxID=1792845 RepID=A0A1S9PHA4_9SPHI|nr:hypothetical protein [Mucilaginibacter pedocola]OOQ60354.1 hypothetical protein BC343_25360 [Mucilaginibacter pedocola]